MIYFALTGVVAFALFLWVVVKTCREIGSLTKQADIEAEREKQREQSKEHDKMSDEDLLAWLRKNGGLVLLLFVLAGCTSRVNSSECVWYREPTAAQCESLYQTDRDLFRKCTLNKMDYREFCVGE